jgi:hypothetical protein
LAAPVERPGKHATFDWLSSWMSEESTPNSGETASNAQRVAVRRILRDRRVGLGALIVIALVAGVVAWVVFGRDSSSKSSRLEMTPIAPVALSASGLTTLATTVAQPIYWAGPRVDYLYELRRSADGNVIIRYLPPDVPAGSPSASFLTVATYPFRDAFQALKKVDGRHISIPGGGVAVVGSTYKKSIHLAYPNVDYQVEVYDPSPAHALALVKSGRVQPAG